MRLVRVAAAAAVGVAVLAGCSTGATANETLPSTSATAAETTESLPPLGPPDLLMPDEAREMTPAGAEAFLRYYMDVYNAAQRTMDTGYLRQLSSGCDNCEQLAAAIDGDRMADYRYQGGDLTVNSVSIPLLQGSRAETAFSITQGPLTVIHSDGSPVEGLSFPARTSPGCGAVLSWSNEHAAWALTQWDVN